MPKYKHPENPDKARADAERARSHAWGTHDARPRKERTRKDARRAAIRREEA